MIRAKSLEIVCKLFEDVGVPLISKTVADPAVVLTFTASTIAQGKLLQLKAAVKRLALQENLS